MVTSLFDLNGRRALVTGGVSGIGRICAEGLLDHGASVVVTSRDAQPESFRELTRRGRCELITIDLSQPEAPASLLDQYLALTGDLDILVNNAGLMMSIRETTCYQKNSYGQGDTAFNKLTTLAILKTIIYRQRAAITSKFPRHKLAPDGTRFAFASTRDGNSEIYVASRDGSNVRRITNNPAIDISPTWSPNSSAEDPSTQLPWL